MMPDRQNNLARYSDYFIYPAYYDPYFIFHK